MKEILIINGPNLNLLGNREKNFYGDTSLEKIKSLCENHCNKNDLKCIFFQSNHEGEIIDKIQLVDHNYEGIIINPAAFTHTSIALLDALRATNKPKIEVHISNIYSREEFRKKSFISPVVDGIIAGFGTNVYQVAINSLKYL